MAHIRTIKPEFFFDEDVSALPDSHQLFFIGLWNHADREGRLEDRPAMLRAQIKPYNPAFPVEQVLAALNPKFIFRYTGQDERRYIQINNFARHQRPHHTERPSLIPAPDRRTLPRPPDNQPPNSPLPHGEQTEGKEGKGREGKGSIGAVPAPDLSTNGDNPVDNTKGQPSAPEFDLPRPPPTPAPSAATATKRPQAPKPGGKATPPREHWQRVYGHVFEWLKKRKHGADPGITDKERGLLRIVYDTYGPWTALALWDMWVEPERKWSKWAYDRGYCLDAFFNTKGAILDDPRWKDKAAGHEKRYIATAKPASDELPIGDVLNGLIASNCKVPEKKK